MSIDGFDFGTISAAQVDPDSPGDTILMTQIRDNIEFLERWLGKSFLSGAVADHDHDGLNSKKVTTADLAGTAADIPGFDAGVQGVPGFGGTPGVLSYSEDSGLAGTVFTSTIPANAKSVNLFFDTDTADSNGMSGILEFGNNKLTGLALETESRVVNLTVTATLQTLFNSATGGQFLRIKIDSGVLTFSGTGIGVKYNVGLMYTIFT